MDTTCANCGKPIKVKPSDYKARGNFCSRACHYASGKPRPNRRKGTERPCEVCGTPFYAPATRPDARFCGRTCKGVASRLPKKQCAVCGKTWQPQFGRGDQPCCSRECGALYRRTGATHTCAVCGVPVYVTANRQGQERYFCSRAHANEWQGRNKTEHTCKTCGKAFRWSPSRQKAYTITYCSLACRDADPARRERLIAMNVMQQRMSPNNVERAGYAILDALGIAYLPQHLIAGKFCVDAYVPTANTVIQFDGDYWHGNPARFPAPDARQRKRMALDRSQDAYMAACGIAVTRLWASEIEGNPEGVAAALRSALHVHESPTI